MVSDPGMAPLSATSTPNPNNSNLPPNTPAILHQWYEGGLRSCSCAGGGGGLNGSPDPTGSHTWDDIGHGAELCNRLKIREEYLQDHRQSLSIRVVVLLEGQYCRDGDHEEVRHHQQPQGQNGTERAAAFITTAGTPEVGCVVCVRVWVWVGVDKAVLKGGVWGGGGGWDPKVHQKWGDQILPVVNIFLPDDKCC